MPLTAETSGIVRYLDAAGIRFRITDIDTPGAHSATSYHYQGLALDLGGPNRAASELLAIFASFGAVESRLAELFYSGAPYGIKNGQRIRPSQAIIDDHWDHVHVAVPKGTILKELPAMPDLSTILIDQRLLTGFAFQDGYVLIAADGAAYCFGCEYKGGLQWVTDHWEVRH